MAFGNRVHFAFFIKFSTFLQHPLDISDVFRYN